MNSLKKRGHIGARRWCYGLLAFGMIGLLSCNNGQRASRTAEMAGPSGDSSKGDYPLSLSVLNDSLAAVTIKSRNVLLKDPFHGLQNFDFDRKGNVYYSQLTGSGRTKSGRASGGDLVYIVQARPNSPAGSRFMTLQYFGHGGTVAVEDSKAGPYVWVSSNATKHLSGGSLESGHYWGARSISRIKFEDGKTYAGYGGESYFLNKGQSFVLIAAIDKANRYICFLASRKKAGGIQRDFYTYRLADVKSAPVKTFTFNVQVGGEKQGDSVRTVTRTVEGHDLKDLKPLGTFSLGPGKDFSTEVNSYSNQGIEIDSEGYIYFCEGNGPSKKRPQGAYITVFDRNGTVVQPRTKVAAIADPVALFYSGLTNPEGAMEAEGIKVIGNKIFLGYSSSLDGSDGKTFRGSNILEYSALSAH